MELKDTEGKTSGVPDLVTAAELLARWNVSIKTIRRMVCDGRLPAPYKVKRQMCWDADRLTEHIQMYQAESQHKQDESLLKIRRLLR